MLRPGQVLMTVTTFPLLWMDARGASQQPAGRWWEAGHRTQVLVGGSVDASNAHEPPAERGKEVQGSLLARPQMRNIRGSAVGPQGLPDCGCIQGLQT
jgi:hypothetical protein